MALSFRRFTSEFYDWLRCSSVIFICFSIISTTMYVIRMTPKTDKRTINIINLLFEVLLKFLLHLVLCCAWFRVSSVNIIINYCIRVKSHNLKLLLTTMTSREYIQKGVSVHKYRERNSKFKKNSFFFIF